MNSLRHILTRLRFMKLNFKKLHGDWRNTYLCGFIWFCASKYVCHVEKLSSTATTYHGCWLEDRTVILLLSNSFFHHVFDELNLFLTYFIAVQIRKYLLNPFAF